MSTNKTKETDNSISEFLKKIENKQQVSDSLALIDFMRTVTGFEAKLWGSSIIGFGSYHYIYESGRSGDAPLVGFSPRKAAISLYVYTGNPAHTHMLSDLGKFKIGKACIYIKKLSDIHLNVLEKIMQESIHYLKEKYN